VRTSDGDFSQRKPGNRKKWRDRRDRSDHIGGKGLKDQRVSSGEGEWEREIVRWGKAAHTKRNYLAWGQRVRNKVGKAESGEKKNWGEEGGEL